MHIAYFLNIGTGELVLIVLFVLMFFGSKSIPELARTLGKGMREFRNASDAVKREITNSVKEVDTNIQGRRNTIQQEFRRTLDQIEDENPTPTQPEKKDDNL